MVWILKNFGCSAPLWRQLLKLHICVNILATLINHAVAGVRTASGAYLSKYTAEYPSQLASTFADHVLMLLSHGPHDLDLQSAEQLLPIKPMQAPPFVRQDGGGNTSSGDWSSPPAGFSDVFKTLRNNWMQLIMKNRMDVQLVVSLQQQSNDPPFSSQQLAPFTNFLVEFLEAQGYPVNWDIPSDQPMRLQSFMLCKIFWAIQTWHCFRIFWQGYRQDSMDRSNHRIASHCHCHNLMDLQNGLQRKITLTKCVHS